MIWLVGIEKNVGGMSHLAKHVIIPACNLKFCSKVDHRRFWDRPNGSMLNRQSSFC